MRVEVGDGGGDQVQGKGGDLGVLAAVAGQIAGHAVERILAGAVVVFHHLQALVDLPPQFLVGEVVADEDRSGDAAEFL
ncbi:hypothetical protein FHR32_004339 [Streptosporangium album]|uniref:Uncharacterized protein n=1 Tax=Streptosporangium album TaxID=47479 RepID=A0A7W7WBB9_9ACTN|nr:hypothetical protein [Streptosporangium album]